jgi:16S rRNA (uracil1498-N3)-methyltransferase
VTLPRFFVPSVGESRHVALTPEEAHHLTHVLRLGPGAEIRMFDGRGREWAGRVASIDRRVVTIEVAREVAAVPEPPTRVTLGVGLLKGDQMDAVVRDATMLGVASIVPMATAHVALPKRARQSDAAIARWQRVAVASARQCGRAVVPTVSPITPFDALLTEAGHDVVIICVEPARAGANAGAAAGSRPSALLVLVGPEGGWSEEEVRFAIGRGARALHLGPRTLRAETTPVVALSSLWTRWGW